MIVRTQEERDIFIEAGRRLAHVLEETSKHVKPGVTTQSLDDVAEQMIAETGDTPAFKNYTPEGVSYPFPTALCVSINNEVVHGIPSNERRLKEGDIVALDLGLMHKGLVVDSALTVPVGRVDAKLYELMDVTQGALKAAIAAARPGARIGDISHATEQAFKGTGFSVVKMLGGHGVGRTVHEEPFIGNVGYPGTGPVVEVGMVLALEPIANVGKGAVEVTDDEYLFVTRDGSVSAHFEHTILIDEEEAVVLTRRASEVA